MGPERSARALVLGAATLLGWGALLAWGGGLRSEPDRPALRVVLLDASASVTRGRVDGRRALREELLRQLRTAEEAGEDLAVVRVQRGASVACPPAPAVEAAQRLLRPDAGDDLLGRALDDGATDLAGALELAAELLAEGGERAPGTVVVVGDGLGTSRDPRRAAAALAEAGHAVHVVLPGVAVRPDVAVTSLRIPQRVPEGAGVLAEVTLEAHAEAAESTLEVELESGGRRQVLEEPLARLRTGERRSFSLQLEPPAGARFTVRARVRAVGDALHENDQRAADGVVAGRPVIVVVDPAGTPTLLLRRDLERAGAQVVSCGLEELRDELRGAAALVTVEVPLGSLPGDGLRRLVEGGGLWLHAGQGGAWAGLVDGPELPPAADLLPLLPAPAPRGPRDVVLAVDGSGSMTGPPWSQVRAAVRSLASSLPASDGLEVRLFTTRLGEPLLAVEPGQLGPLAAGLERLLAARVPGGATDIAQVLEELAATRATAGRRSLCVLLSDGHSSHGSSVLQPSLRDGLAAQQADLAVVAVESGGRRAAREALRNLLRDEEPLHEGGDLEGLGTLLEELVTAEHRLPPGPVLVHPEPPAELAALASAWSGRQDLVHGGARRAALQAEASALLVEPDGAPLLAMARRGAGRVVGAALPPGSAQLAPLWAELVLGLLPQEGEAEQVWLDLSQEPPRVRGILAGRPLEARLLQRGGRDLLGFQLPDEVVAAWPVAPRAGDPGGPREVRLPPDPALRSPSPSLLLELWDGDALATRLPAPLPLPPDLVRPPWPALTSVPARSVPVQDPDGSAPGLLTGAGLGLLALAGLARPGGRRRAPLKPGNPARR